MTGQARDPRPLAWPDRSQWLAYLKFMLVFYALFFPIYFGAPRLASAQPAFLFFAWETRIPLVPWMIWPYFSLFTLFVIPLFQMSAEEMRRLTLQSTIPLLAAGLCFVMFPCRIGFPAIEIDGLHRPVFALLRAVDMPQNLVPSLHIAFSALILVGAHDVATARLRPFYLAWMAVIMGAVVLVHQHHVIDVITGLAVAAIARAAFPLAVARRASAARIEQPAHPSVT